uniref:Genome polyprotein n=2 Tax=Wild tomato mosaic virus TaxID=400396 RepID=A0A411I6W0_9POTV|nr:polyprotein [Wild tomato mosaic virus]
MAAKVAFPWVVNPEIKQGVCRSRGVTLQFGSFAPITVDWVQEGADLVQQFHEKMCDFDEACISMIRDRSNDRVVKRHGVLTYAPKTPSILRKERKALKLKNEKEAFLSAPDTLVAKVCFPPEATRLVEELPTKFPPVIHRKRKVSQMKTSVAVSSAHFHKLLREIVKICGEMEKPLDVIGVTRGVVRTKIVKRSASSQCLVCETKHHNGIIQSVDVHIPRSIKQLVHSIATLAWKGTHLDETSCRTGDSGVCIPRGHLKFVDGNFNNEMTIVRGAFRGKLIDAQQHTSKRVYTRMVHFSAGEKFWEGFNKGFLTHRKSPIIHTGSNTIDVVECGLVAAIMCQSLMPCCRITCTVCAKQYADSDINEISARIMHSLTDGIAEIEEKFPSFPHAVKFLQDYQRSLSSDNPNREASSKVQFLIGERRDQPFMHILNINEVLMRGGRASSAEFARASDDLLELARHHKNRVESLKKGSLHLFRNKVASKAHLNPSLMCDNQLDVNGNFVWGKRGYHAKRFFSNFFELIQPSDGYDKYIVRNNPNGSRKLAIGNLILSTNLESLRKQLEGEPIESFPLTEQCIGRRHESFIYPTCCVTYDDGTPLLSEFKAPTKNHLVLGNSGDSKYLDLPTEISENLYIAQEGYCYVNIFLAMLVEVDEKDAKDFTKWVRDIIVRQLDKWPTMTDVALACYQLSVLFPSTRSAELPRILVDHKTKTMHVVDSFGSLTTGYHILKANTVSQLILFASDTLESEMKTYYVGGSAVDFSEHTENFKRRLFRSVYRPSEFKKLILEEPVILTLSLMSPTLISELYWSGGLHRAMQMMQGSDMNMKMIVSTILDLSKKVVKADDLFNQSGIISAYVDVLLNRIKSMPAQSLATTVVLEFLLVHQSTNDIDSDLSSLGFRTLKFRSLHLMEKIYKVDLEAQWCELSWLERSCAIYYTLKSRIQCMRDLKQDSSQILKQALNSSTTFVQDKMCIIPDSFQVFYSKSVVVAKSIKRRVYNRLYRCAVNSFSDAFQFLQTMAILSILLSVFANLLDIKNKYRCSLQISEKENNDTLDRAVFKHYTDLRTKLNQKPTEDEFSNYLKEVDPDAFVHWFGKDFTVQHQASKRPSEAKLEQIVAFVALLMMVFDGDRGDCVYKVLNKLRNVMGSVDNEAVNHQSIDSIRENFEEANEMIEFEITAPDAKTLAYKSSTFQVWWDNQISMNNVISHYRTEGKFIEFSRDKAAHVANEIATSDERDYLIRGAVGSGKSTGLPHHLCKKGKVLLLEPTRPLAENVHAQLSQQPFHHNPTLMMRNKSVFGSTPITIMTSGYALHYLANNSHRLQEFAFILFDECHVLDANAMAFRSLLADRAYEGKILKVSATPPGRETEFKTQYPVKLKTEESLSFQQFVDAQGTGANADVTGEADNILVYVSSYNEVDQLAKMLVDRHHKVTKVDGRTMKSGAAEIKTFGTALRKHFIVATNIIENGVTIDIDAVVDFGLKINASVDIDCRMIRYTKGSINYGERIQRLGRVGRTKPGVALRIGHTNKGIEAVPTMIANEAAFLCFMYGLPVMTAQVSTSILSQCTVQQARVMALFELPIYFMMDFVASDGTMHPAIHALLKKYKLRESEVLLTKLAIPHAAVHKWMSVREYNQCTRQLDMEPDIRLSFHVKDVPEALYEKLWHCVQQHKGDAGFRRISSHNAAKIAHKLRTDDMAVQRTICYIDQLIASEMQKKEHFDSLVNAGTSSLSFTLQSVSNMIRSRYAKDYSVQNLSVLHAARAQLVEFNNLHQEHINDGVPSLHLMRDNIMDCGAMETVVHQNKEEISRFLKLKGVWNGALLTRDVLIAAGVACGGAWMMYQYLIDSFSDKVDHQAQSKNKRQRQKLKFRDARDNKVGRIIVDDDSGAVEHFFGSAYNKKNKGKGKTHGMGKKNRRFVNMYGFDPTEYSFIRFVDPLTGEMLDESVMADIMLVQEHFHDLRYEYLQDDKIEGAAMNAAPGITAYFVKDKISPVLKVDLTAHVPLKVCDNSSTIAGFPERENELRQTGQGKLIDPSELPKLEAVGHEAHSLHKGLRDYNNISKLVCKIENTSDAITTSIHGVGFGSVIISNRHLFKRNNGELKVKSTHGDFKVVNTKELRIHPIEKYDIILIRLPKDFPPFPTKVKFRKPTLTDSVCLIGTNFQERFLSSLVSSFSSTGPVEKSNFWRHWIDTKDGHCGLPLVAQEDGAIVGFHSLTSMSTDKNYFAAVPEDMHDILKSVESLEWRKGWLYNPDEIGWGSLKLTTDTPSGMFKISKLVEDLHSTFVQEQSQESWLYAQLTGNLKAVGRSESQLVTKHVVKGPCQLFQLYLQTDEEAKRFFKPLMGQYAKSRLNRTAYAKDILKYSTEIEVGKVDTDLFEKAIGDVIADLHAVRFCECEYVTDEEAIFQSLNMKSAVGALYKGKKREYFETYSVEDKQKILEESCLRLYMGKLGVWNGSIKAELRPIEKVQANKTRTFTAAPIDTLLAGKVCVDDFNNQFYSKHTEAPWSVGISKFSGGWDKLLRKLPEGWTYCSADGSRFDSSLTPYLINAVLSVRLHFMEKWSIGEQMLKNLYAEIIYTPILTADGTVVKKFKGNNSGQPSTVVDNTLMVLLAMRYSLRRLGLNYEDQCRECEFFANGDDLIVAVKPHNTWILDNLSDIFQELGLSYDFSERTEKRSELWFMSHQGKEVEGMYIPKLEEQRIVSILEWDRAEQPEHRLEAICAAMIEAWGYPELLHQIRRFYKWILEQAPYSSLVKAGKAPYISEMALRNLYTNKTNGASIDAYIKSLIDAGKMQECVDDNFDVRHQAGETVDAGKNSGSNKESTVQKEKKVEQGGPLVRDKDVNVGTSGTFSIPRLKGISSKLTLPKTSAGMVVNLEHLLEYKPDQIHLSNARALNSQFQSWYDGVKNDYDVNEEQMKIIMNGLMVWCIENGTSPNINGMWVMMDGEEQVEFPIKPLIDHAKPSFRQIMAHFSNLAEAYIEKRNSEKPYMPRYGLQRNLTDMSLARYAFDFYEMTSKTPSRAREAHIQMKAAALRNANNRMFGLDGKVGTQEEDTERHTAEDVNRNMHNLLGVRGV